MDFQIKPQPKKQPTLKPSLLADTDQDESSPSLDIRKEALHCASQVQAATYQLVAEDPTALAYDSVYDSFKPPKAKTTPTSQPQYIPAMRRAAFVKSKERQIIREKVEAKERRKEEEETGVTERIYTASFRKMMEENRKLEEEMNERDEAKLQHTVNSQGGSRVFFANLLEHIAGGAPVKRPKTHLSEEIAPIPVDEKPSQDVEIPTMEKEQAPPVPEKKSEDVVQSARERYLQRKAQQLALDSSKS